jgi:hypothetical protein
MSNKGKHYNRADVEFFMDDVRSTPKWAKIAHPRFMKYVGYSLFFEWPSIFNHCATPETAAEYAFEYTLKNWDGRQA